MPGRSHGPADGPSALSKPEALSALRPELHDALVAVGKAEQWDQVPAGTLRILKDAVEAAAQAEGSLNVELLARALYGARWYEAHFYHSAERYAAEYARLAEKPHD